MLKSLSMLLLAALLCGLPVLQPAVFAQDGAERAAERKGASGLPLPRFVSLKSNRVNVRKGPSTDHAVEWVFSRAGLPVEVIAESDNWRRGRLVLAAGTAVA